MRAITYTKYGPPDVLRVTELEEPIPESDEVLIRIHAASVNPLDWRFMRGSPYGIRIMTGFRKPKETRLGVDVAGRVESVGNEVTEFKPGDAVFGACKGAFADYVTGSEDDVVHKPANVTFEQAAAVPIAAMTAPQGLRDKGKVERGQKVLINGAAGGVGTFAVQIARWLGADVTGVCSTRNVDMVRSIGADQVIDYTREDFTRSGKPYDLIIDMIGNHSMSDYRSALIPKGRLVLVGGDFRAILKAVVLSPFVKQDLGVIVSKSRKEDLRTLKELIEARTLIPVIDRTYSLAEVPEAIRYLEEGHARGKVVITMDGSVDE